MGESGGLSAALLTAASWSCDQGAVNPSNCPISAHCSSRQAGPGRCERIGPSRKRGTRLSPQAQGPHRECTTRKPFGVWHTKLRVHSYTSVCYQFRVVRVCPLRWLPSKSSTSRHAPITLGQATTLEVSTVVVLHSRIDEARQAAWPGRRGCTPRPSQPSQLRRRLTTRLVGSRIALRITEFLQEF